MKKFAVILCLALCLSILCACAGNNNPVEETTTTTEITTTAIPTVRVTFPEGFTAVQIAEKLEEKGVCSAKAFLALVTDDEYLSTLTYRFVKGIESPSDRPFNLEGYIFPDTYEFYKGESAERALKRFLDNTEKKLTDEYYLRAEELGYTMDEIISLAAIAIPTSKPLAYYFISRRGKASSPKAAVAEHFRTITPAFSLTSSMDDSERFSFEKAQGYGRIARTTRAGDIGDWILYTFETPVKCRSMKIATGNFQLPRYIFENGYVEISYNGIDFFYAGELNGGIYYIEEPEHAIKAVRVICTSQGNGAEWVSIQPPTIYPIL